MADENVDLLSLINPTDKQKIFLWALDRYKYILYGGAAGGGKSYVLRWGAVWQLIKWFAMGLRNVEVGIFCETYPTLHSRHLSKIRSEFPEWLGTLYDADKSDLRYVLNEQYGGGIIRFRNLDNVEKYKSSEFAMIMVDELTFNSYQTFNDLRFRLRWPGIERPIFAAATNPGGPGHAWVKSLWIDRVFPEEIREAPATLRDGERGKLCDEFIYIPAKTSDNPYLAASYDEGLLGLPEAMRRAYRDGSWDIFAGQVFSEWDRGKHVVAPFAIPRHWDRFMGYDHGYAKPFSLLWGAVDDTERRNIWIYRELYGSFNNTPNVGAREDVETIAGRICSIEGKGEPNGVFIHRVADPSIWQNNGLNAMYRSIADVFSSRGIHFSRGNNDRLQGLMVVHEYLKWNDAGTGEVFEPRLKIFNTCQHLIRTLPALPYDKHRVEDIDTDAEDHSYDCLRYLLMLRPNPSEIPRVERQKSDWFYESVYKQVHNAEYDEVQNGPKSWIWD